MKKGYGHNIFLISLFLIFILLSYYLFKNAPDYLISLSREKNYNVNSTGPTGDTYGGTLGPIVAWLAALLTFAAFWVQYRANQQQRRQIEEQGKETTIDRFENKFYELIRLHRSNVEEMNIQDIIKERKVFIPMFYEFRYIYYQAEEFFKLHENTSITDENKKELVNISYLLFFFGVGYNSDKTHLELFDKYLGKSFFLELINELKEKKKNYKTWHGQIGEAGQLKVESHEAGEIVFKVKYKPFNGHSGKLGHYFRHLFQTVKFVDEQSGEYFTKEVKYNYLKTLRAQLSNFEQLLLYYNHLSVIGQPWERYLKEYHLIKNMPLPYADFGVVPQQVFDQEINEIRLKNNGKEFFEWYEIKTLIK